MTEASAVYRTLHTNRSVQDDKIFVWTSEYVDYLREEYSDDMTLTKALQSICEAGVDETKATEIINKMLEHGILFRERKPRS